MIILKILGAAVQLSLNLINDSHYKKNKKVIQQKTYKQTGKALEQARANGKWISGAVLYQKKLSNNLSSLDKAHARRAQLIKKI